MVVFSFVPTAKRGFFVSSFSSRSSTCLPPLLDATIKNTNEAGEDICYVSVGLDGSYFLGTQKRNNHYGYTNFPPLLTLFEAASASSPGTFSSDSVRWISFTPDHKGYFMCFVLADQKPLYAWACLPESLNKILEGNAIEDNDVLNFVSFGKDGSWVLTIEGKKPMWDGVPKDLEERLRGSDTIATVALALDAEDEYFMEYEDGGIWMIIPKEWHRTVKPHLDDKGAIEQINVLRQQRLNTQNIGYAAAIARAAQMDAMTTLAGMDATAEIVSGTTRRTEWYTTYGSTDGSDVGFM